MLFVGSGWMACAGASHQSKSLRRRRLAAACEVVVSFLANIATCSFTDRSWTIEVAACVHSLAVSLLLMLRPCRLNRIRAMHHFNVGAAECQHVYTLYETIAHAAILGYPS